MPSGSLFTFDDLIQLEVDLVEALRQQGLTVDSIKLIGLKGQGESSTVFSVLINDIYHVLKVYRDRAAYDREISYLRKEVPLDRFFFVWHGDTHRHDYDIVILEMPEGSEMRSSDLTPEINEALAGCFIRLHSLRGEANTSAASIALRLQEKSIPVMEHIESYGDITAGEIQGLLTLAVNYLNSHKEDFEGRSSNCHGDPWWGNIIIADEAVYLIDWEGSKFDDYCEDLAKFCVLTEYERTQEPRDFWDTPEDRAKLDGFMESLLVTYEKHFDDPNIHGRFGFYCLYLAAVVFGDRYYDPELRGSDVSRRILEQGIKYFRRYCLAE